MCQNDPKHIPGEVPNGHNIIPKGHQHDPTKHKQHNTHNSAFGVSMLVKQRHAYNALSTSSKILAQLNSLTFLEPSTQQTQLGPAECANRFTNLLDVVLSGFRELRRVRTASKSSPRCREGAAFVNRDPRLLLARSWATLRPFLGR